MPLDPILAEIRQTRDAYAARFGGDIKAMLADLRQRQQQGNRAVVSRPAKRISVQDMPPLQIGRMIRPLSPDDDLLGEMLDETRF
jgi:hypothetical protein